MSYIDLSSSLVIRLNLGGSGLGQIPYLPQWVVRIEGPLLNCYYLLQETAHACKATPIKFIVSHYRGGVMQRAAHLIIFLNFLEKKCPNSNHFISEKKILTRNIVEIQYTVHI